MSALTYHYRAIDKAGDQRRGQVRAGSEQDAYRKLTAEGLTPIKLRESAHGVSRARGRGKITPREISHFTYQLAVLMEARIPIADGLISIAEQEPNQSFRAMLQEIAGAIQAGSTITNALEPHRRVFGDVYVETVHAAERSGNMMVVLEALAEMMETQAESHRQLRAALTYPTVVVTALSAATIFLLVFVVPKFAAMFAQRGVELPLLTQALQAFGLSIRAYWFIYAAAVGSVVMGVRVMWRSPQGRWAIDRALHKAPVVRSALVGIAVSRFTRVLGLCLSSGLGLLESLEMSGRATGRPLLQRDVMRLMNQVRRGDRLSLALRECEYLPSFCRRMIAAGEESAELTRMCRVVSRHYERDVGHLMKSVATIVEPALIAVMTMVVLMVALAVFLPMWDMVGLVG